MFPESPDRSFCDPYIAFFNKHGIMDPIFILFFIFV